MEIVSSETVNEGQSETARRRRFLHRIFELGVIQKGWFRGLFLPRLDPVRFFEIIGGFLGRFGTAVIFRKITKGP